MILALILGLLILAVIFGWAAGKVRSLAMIVAGAAITGGAG